MLIVKKFIQITEEMLIVKKFLILILAIDPGSSLKNLICRIRSRIRPKMYWIRKKYKFLWLNFIYCIRILKKAGSSWRFEYGSATQVIRMTKPCGQE